MTKTIATRLLVGLLLVSPSWADTLTMRNNAEINGHVVFQGDDFTLTAKYRAGTKKITFHRAEVASIEINDRDFNPGEPPTDISAFRNDHGLNVEYADGQTKKRSTDATSSNPSTTDIILLRDKTRLTGRLVRMENGQLTFQMEKGSKKINLTDILSILVAPK